MHKLIAALALFASIGAHAAQVAVYCAPVATTTYTNGPTSNTISSEVSPTATGRSADGLSSNVTVCALPSTKPSTWYLRVSNDGGSTYSFVTLASLGFGVSAAAPPPPSVAASAVVSWQAPTVDSAGNPLTIALTYNLYRGTSATQLTKLASVAGLSYTDPAGSATPTTYFYAVTATCPVCTESAESAIVSATLQASAIQPAAPVMLTPVTH